MPVINVTDRFLPTVMSEDEAINEAAFTIQRALRLDLSSADREAIRTIIRNTVRPFCLGSEEHVEQCAALLPAWFVPRMMTDCWGFGFLLTTGDRVHFECINDVRRAGDGTIWIDVTLHRRVPFSAGKDDRYIVAVADDRTDASVNAAHIVMAFETETS